MPPPTEKTKPLPTSLEPVFWFSWICATLLLCILAICIWILENHWDQSLHTDVNNLLNSNPFYLYTQTDLAKVGYLPVSTHTSTLSVTNAANQIYLMPTNIQIDPSQNIQGINTGNISNLFVSGDIYFNQNQIAQWINIYNTQTSTIVSSTSTVSATDYYLPPTLPNVANSVMINNDLPGQNVLRWSDQRSPISFTFAAINTLSMSFPLSTSIPKYVCNYTGSTGANYSEILPPNDNQACTIVKLPGNIAALGFTEAGNYWISYYSRFQLSSSSNTLSTTLVDIQSNATYAAHQGYLNPAAGGQPYIVNNFGPYLYTISSAQTTLALEVTSAITDNQAYMIEWCITSYQAV